MTLRALPETTVRDASTADAAAIAILLGQLGYPAPTEVAARRLERVIADPSNRVLVAEISGEVIGVAGLHVFSILNEERPAARLTILAVLESRRGEGVGRRLVEAVESIARALGCGVIEVTSGIHRPDAHAFYERLGYAERPKRFYKRLDAPIRPRLTR